MGWWDEMGRWEEGGEGEGMRRDWESRYNETMDFFPHLS